MTLPSSSSIQNSVSLRPSTLPLEALGLGFPKYWIFTSEREKKHFIWHLEARVGFEPSLSDFPSWHRKPMPQATTLVHIQFRLNWTCWWRCDKNDGYCNSVIGWYKHITSQQAKASMSLCYKNCYHHIHVHKKSSSRKQYDMDDQSTASKIIVI